MRFWFLPPTQLAELLLQALSWPGSQIISSSIWMICWSRGDTLEVTSPHTPCWMQEPRGIFCPFTLMTWLKLSWWKLVILIGSSRDTLIPSWSQLLAEQFSGPGMSFTVMTQVTWWLTPSLRCLLKLRNLSSSGLPSTSLVPLALRQWFSWTCHPTVIAPTLPSDTCDIFILTLLSCLLHSTLCHCLFLLLCSVTKYRPYSLHAFAYYFIFPCFPFEWIGCFFCFVSCGWRCLFGGTQEMAVL